jgi:stringent starvation protein B
MAIEKVSKKYYLINAMYQWCVDSGLSPCILVLVDSNVKVPVNFVEDDNCILLDISPEFVRNFDFNKNSISFYAMFDDIEHEVFVPIGNVLEIYAAENEEGMEFAFEENLNENRNHKRSFLKLVK